jgi:hypothetical protein
MIVDLRNGNVNSDGRKLPYLGKSKKFLFAFDGSDKILMVFVTDIIYN